MEYSFKRFSEYLETAMGNESAMESELEAVISDMERFRSLLLSLREVVGKASEEASRILSESHSMGKGGITQGIP